ncbi:winged helix-turn-helix transcriptional regulator [Dongia sp.]|uniref:winged helix-turn-helix transcriptional regulator n=1 Tax=Dongia sp. TaxID=1977262 RepID=UPI0035B189CF
MAVASTSIFLAERRVRLFKRRDRPSRYWQAAFHVPGRARPLVKSTGQIELATAKRWALDFLTQHSEQGTMPAPLPREDLLAPYPFPHIRQKKRHVEREIALRTLSAYRHNPILAQRELARALNVSLAIVNAYIARCVRAGWLLKLERPEGRGRGYRYALTESGERQLHDLLAAYVSEELSLFRTLRADFAALLGEAGDRPVILRGESELAAIARLVLAESGRTPLPDRTAQAIPARQRRQYERAVIWQTDLGAPATGTTRNAAIPALLRHLGFGGRIRVRSKTNV